MNAGDFALGATFDIKFTTIDSTGAPITLAGTPVISAYPDNSTTQLTAGITLSVDFDSVTGLHNVRVVASSGNGYADGSSYALVITTGTVDSVSVVGYVVAHFTIGRSAAFARLGAPAGASIAADIAVIESQTDDIGVAGAGLTEAGGTGDHLTALATAANLATVDTVVDAILVDTAEIGVAGSGLTEAGGTGDQLTALATAANLATVDTVVDAILVDTAEIGAAGAGLTVLATQTSVNTVDTVVDAIKVQTDKFVFTVANQVDSNTQSINDTALTGDGGATPWGPA